MENYTSPLLHYTIGKGNNILKFMALEAQAIAESYSASYYTLEEVYQKNVHAYYTATEDLNEFIETPGQYLCNMKAPSTTDKDTYKLIVAEFDELTKIQSTLISNKKLAKEAWDAAQKEFEEEAAKEENRKSHGQPL